MSSIVDWQIRELAEQKKIVEPFNCKQLNPGSYDVILASTILTENYKGYTQPEMGRWVRRDISAETYFMRPNEFVLASTEEIIRVPENMEAVFCLKSSRGREGYNHVLSAYIDSGFEGRITLELHNCSRVEKLPLKQGLRIGQIRFAYMDAVPEEPYNKVGRYHMDMDVMPSKG